MINLGKTYSMTSPQEVEFTNEKVFLAKNIHKEQMAQPFGGEPIQMYAFDLEEYGKDEYLAVMQEQLAQFDELKHDLHEVLSMMQGGGPMAME